MPFATFPFLITFHLIIERQFSLLPYVHLTTYKQFEKAEFPPKQS